MCAFAHVYCVSHPICPFEILRQRVSHAENSFESYLQYRVSHINLKLIDKYTNASLLGNSSDFLSENIIMFARVYFMKMVKGCM